MCIYKRLAKHIFYKNVNKNDSHQQITTCTFIYIYNKTMRNVYIYIQKARHFSKSKTISVTFLFTKIQTHYVTRFFMKFLKLAFKSIQKAWQFALRDVFIYKNPDTSKKSRQLALSFLYIKKSWHFVLLKFSWNFEIGGGDGGR